jgi:hypothetical protein
MVQITHGKSGESKMQISRSEQAQIKRYNLEQVRLQEKREDDYRKLVEKRKFDEIVAERIARNIRLDLDKGRNIDIEC